MRPCSLPGTGCAGARPSGPGPPYSPILGPSLSLLPGACPNIAGFFFTDEETEEAQKSR